MVLAAFAIVFAIFGLTPSLAWIPELPLLLVAFLVPVAILAGAGYRSARTTAGLYSGPIAGSLAGAIGGATGGLAYVIYGKPVINIPIGMAAGAAAGVVLGALGAMLTRRV